MRMLKMMLVGALALGGLTLAEAPASASPMVAPGLIQVATVGASAEASAAPCYWHHGWHRRWGYHPYHRWHRWGYHPHYGWHRRAYGFYRPYGWHHRHWHRWHRFY